MKNYELGGVPGRIAGSTYFPDLRTHHISPQETEIQPKTHYFIAGGFGTLASRSFEPLIVGLARRGAHVWAIDDRPLSDMPQRRTRRDRVPLYTIQRATDIRRVLETVVPTQETDPKERVILVAHSRGNQGAIMAAADAEAKVDQILSANAPGYIGRHGLLPLALNFLRCMRADGKNPDIQAIKEQDNEILRQQIGFFPQAIPLLLREAREIAAFDLSQWVLIAKQKGIDLRAIISLGDLLFPPKFLREQCKRMGIPYQEGPGPHGAMSLRRHADHYADLFLSLLPV